MMTAKARGKSQIVLFDEQAGERPEGYDADRDVRSIAHLKLLQSLVKKLNRLSSVREIGEAIVGELRGLLDYHSCRVYLIEGDELVPVAVKGDVATDEEQLAALRVRVGEGMTGYVAATGRSLLVANALDCEHAVQIPGTEAVDESVIAVPLRYGSRVNGVVFLSKLGVGQFDENDLRLLEVLAGYASVALENARLYEAVKREADNAKAWLQFSDAISSACSLEALMEEVVRTVARLMHVRCCSLWLEDEKTQSYRCTAACGDGAEALVGRSVPQRTAEAVLDGRTMPFVLSLEACDQLWGGDEDSERCAEAMAPLQAGYGVRGWIGVRGPGEHLSQARLHLLEGLAYRASAAIQEALLRRDQQQSLHVANALLDFARTLAKAASHEVPDRIVERAAETLGCDKASLWLQQEQGGEIVPVAVCHPDPAQRERVLATRYPAEVAESFSQAAEPVVLRPGDCAGIPGAADLAEGREVAVAPFTFDAGLMGFLVATARAGEGFDELSLKMLAGLADQAKLAIAGSR